MIGRGWPGLALLSLFALGLFHSCGQIEPHLAVLRGNSAYRKGDYQEANVEYLGALEFAEYADYVSFNLGAVYNALGENEAALDEWQKVLLSRNASLSFKTIFNLGTLYYRQGRYEEAYRSFRKALELEPGNMSAKINLEHALAKLQAKGREKDSGQSAAATPGRFSEEVTRVLDYVQRKEGQVWRAPVSVSSTEETMDW